MDSLKPQDILVLLKLCSLAGGGEQVRPSMAALGIDLGLSPSEVHAALVRCRTSGFLQPALMPTGSPEALSAQDRLLTGRRTRGSERPNVTAITEFLVHGLKYVFPAKLGELTRGVPTSYAAPPLNKLIAQGQDPPPVWPYLAGQERGAAMEPLYRTVPFAALRDPLLYELLAIVDALRDGRARERKVAEEQLRERLRRVHAA